MCYVETSPANVREHKKYHDRVVHGVKYKHYKSERCIYQNEDEKITVIDDKSNKFERANAVEVGILGYQDAGYDMRPFDSDEVFKKDSKVKVFLLHKEGRTIGFLVVEKAELLWSMTWDKYPKEPKRVDHTKILWSGRFIWVHKKYRSSGLAKRLIENALKDLNIKIDDFGYSTQLSEEGRRFAQSISPRFLRTRAIDE